MSHPSWVCGLKHTFWRNAETINMSHPSWVCGLKHRDNLKTLQGLKSHPSWVCGLKLSSLLITAIECRVTPFVGVWIETFLLVPLLSTLHSHTLRGCVD